MKHTPENIIVKKLKSGDTEAFNELFARYSGRLYGFGLKYLKVDADTEELVQNIFYKIWKNRERLDPDRSFKSYIFTIAFNEICDSFQRKAVLAEFEIEGFHIPTDITQEDVAYNSALDTIKGLLEKLPERQREIFELSRFENLSSKEISDRLGITSKTVDNQVSEVIRFLRSRIGNNLGCLLLLLLIS